MTAGAPAHARADAPARGIGCMVLGGLLLTLNDATIKWLTGGLPVGQIMFSRGLVAILIIVAVVAVRRRPAALKVTRPGAQAARAAAMVCSTFLFVSGLRWLPLADAVALSFIGPVLLTAMAPFFLGENVGWRRWSAVLIGFAGMLVMLRPGTDGIQWAALLPVGAAFAGTVRDILTRRLAGSDGSLATLFYSTLGVALAGLATAPLGWNAPAPIDFALLALTGCLLCSAHFLQIEAFRLAEAAVLAPFKYTSLLWAAIVGFAVWQHVPDAVTLSGGALVVASGLYIFRREQKLKRTATVH
jgi:drug/metabolite transporter (DMT)-like permease